MMHAAAGKSTAGLAPPGRASRPDPLEYPQPQLAVAWPAMRCLRPGLEAMMAITHCSKRDRGTKESSEYLDVVMKLLP